MTKPLVIGYFYKKLLNLYGDNGNIEVLTLRASSRGIPVTVIDIEPGTKMSDAVMKEINLVFMGGGPDSSQKQVYSDLIFDKGTYLKDYIEKGGVGLYVCGSYQLLGHYYKTSDGETLDGLGVFDIHTEHGGPDKPRFIGNTVAKIDDYILEDPVFKSVNTCDFILTGFENHGGLTYLAQGVTPFARMIRGNGNNGEDGTEGAIYKNSFGTYFHGPILSRNPHTADYLISKALQLDTLDVLEDKLAHDVHTASQNLK